MSTVLSSTPAAGHYLVSEASGSRSRRQGTIASGSGVLRAAAVLGKVTASGKYKPLAPAADDGTQTAAAVLFEGCDATAADVRRTVTDRDCEVSGAALVWPAGITDPQKTSALAALTALGIIAR